MAKLTHSEIMGRFRVAERTMEGWHKKIRARRKMYSGEHYRADPKDGEHQYIDPSYMNVTDIATAIIIANRFEFRAKTWDMSTNSVEDASKVEKLLSGIIAANNRRLESSLEYRAGFDFCRDGCAVVYTVWDNLVASESRMSFEWAGEEKVEKSMGYSDVPIYMEFIDPLEMYFIIGGKHRWQEVFRKSVLSVFEAEQEYDIEIPAYMSTPAVAKMNIQISRYDYWREVIIKEDGKSKSTVEHAIILDHGIEIQPLKEAVGYSQLPYTMQFFKPVSPYSTDSGKWGHSIIDPMAEPVKHLERAVNRVLRQVDMYTGLPLIVNASNRNIQLNSALSNQVVQLSSDEDIKFPQWQGNPPDVYQSIDIFRAHAQQSSFPNSLMGTGPNQVSGYAISQMTDQGRIRLEQPVHHLELLWEIWAKKVLDLLDYFARDQVIRVYGQMGQGNFLDKIIVEGLNDILVTCRIRPKFPNDEARRHSMATQASGFLSQYTLLQNYFDIEQPDDEMDRRAFESLEGDPVVQLYSIINVLRRKANEGDSTANILLRQALQALNSQMGRGAAIGGGTPGVSQVKPGTQVGTPSSTGQLTPQEQGGSPPGMGMGG